MDINDLRSITTVLSMLAFAGIVAWALRRSNRSRFDEAAMLPFAEDMPQRNGSALAQGPASEAPTQHQNLKDRP